MTVTNVVEQLRRAHALVAEARAAAVRAEIAIGEGGEIFDGATRGSIWPQVVQMRRLSHDAGDDVRLANAALGEALDIIDGYCRSIAGHGIAGVVTGADQVEGASSGPAGERAGRTPDAELIAERVQAGVVIRPGSVDRISRLPDGRTVWAERGSSNGGVEHILSKRRIEDFANVGVPKDRMLDLVFAALERGTVVGYSGIDRPVYEVVFEGERRRVAITVTDTGLIVGAHPISLKRKLRTHRYRS